jgi:hypothetical protein
MKASTAARGPPDISTWSQKRFICVWGSLGMRFKAHSNPVGQ